MVETLWGKTNDYTAPTEFVPWSKKWEFSETADVPMIIDSRLCLISKRSVITSVNPLRLYANYNKLFCEFTNRSDNTQPAIFAKCGFLPIGVEPECLCGEITYKRIVPLLSMLGIEFFEVAPSSPVKRNYKAIGLMATNRDIWISKLEAQKLVHKPAYNITASDVLEVLL